ncbi:MAG: metallophosphoesterase family protein, partial [Mycobacteriales bacterium]
PTGTGAAAGERRSPDTLQPAPYFAIDAGPVRFVGIDTGITGDIDEDQYHWLRRVSLDAPERPKILLTGKPIYVDGEHHPGRVTGRTETVDSVVTDTRANYVMAIGGDIHNYQRYPVPVAGGRTIQYVVSGGGGAYMHATHRIPSVNVNGVDESMFRCYPLRRDSLARFSEVIDKKLFGGSGLIAIDAPAAGRYYEQRGVATARSGRSIADRISLGKWVKAAVMHRLPVGRFFHRIGSEVFDFDDPPFFKQFLRIDADTREITVSCFGVTGCADTEHTPPVEDRFTIIL